MSTPNGYGTAGRGSNHHTPARQRAGDNAHDEEQPLLNGVGTRGRENPKSLTSRLRRSATAEIRRDWADVVLIFCYIITGMLDSSAISDWGSFVSMQTGRVIIIDTKQHTVSTTSSKALHNPARAPPNAREPRWLTKSPQATPST
jgi:hypothetical protein